jgi:hypothetical protein
MPKFEGGWRTVLHIESWTTTGRNAGMNVLGKCHVELGSNIANVMPSI